MVILKLKNDNLVILEFHCLTPFGLNQSGFVHKIQTKNFIKKFK